MSDDDCYSDHDVDANAPPEEEVDAQSLKGQALRALGRLCFEHCPMEYIYPQDRRMLLQKLLPLQYQPDKNDTVMERTVVAKLNITAMTAAECRGLSSPSRHRITGGMVWRHVQIRVPPPACRLPLPSDASDELKEQHADWTILSSLLNSPHDVEVGWSHKLVKQWVREEGKDPKTKQQQKRGLIAFPPIAVISQAPTPTTAGLIRCVINDAFSDDITATVVGSRSLVIRGEHSPPGGAVLPEGVTRSDDIPRGPWSRTFPFTFALATAEKPRLAEYDNLACIEVDAPPTDLVSEALKRKPLDGVGRWLVKRNPPTSQ